MYSQNSEIIQRSPEISGNHRHLHRKNVVPQAKSVRKARQKFSRYLIIFMIGVVNTLIAFSASAY